jgi:tetratricopeptide (TPR) repeat protein
MRTDSPSVAAFSDATLARLLHRVEEEPGSLHVRLELAIGYNARNMPDEARAAAETVLERDPENGDAWYEAIIARSFGGAAALLPAHEAVAALTKRHPRASWAWRNLGLLSYYLERDEEAKEACRQACHLDAGDSRAQEVMAYLAYTVGDLDGAVEHGIKAVELDPGNFRALHWLGECYVRLDAPDQAIRYFLRALRIEDCFFFALESLAGLHLRHHSGFMAAWQCMARIMSVNPRYFPAYFRLADALIPLDRLTEAAGLCETVLHLDPDRTARADPHQYLGLIRLMAGEPGARPHFEEALALDSKFAAAHHYLGVLAEQEGDLDEAEASWRRAIAADPSYAQPHVRLGYLAFDRKEFENARRSFERALEIDPDDHVAHLGMGEVARWRKEYPAQLEHCLRAAEIAPDDSNVRNQLGTAYDALGRSPEAIHEYEAALELDPHDRQAANNLGYLYERMLKEAKGDEAARIREKAVAAWRRRLLICRDTRSSTKGARSHLAKLGVQASEVDEWLETSVIRQQG